MKKRFTPNWTIRTVLLVSLLPLHLACYAQDTTLLPTPLPDPEDQYISPAQPLPYRTQLTASQILPPSPQFDVPTFEILAEQLTYGERVPGLAMAIVQNGKVLSARGYGITDVSAPQLVDAHTVYRLASLSKAFASATAGLIVNDGTLRWDSKVTDYVPNFQLNDPIATQQVTVADVLSHRIGLHKYNTYDRDIEANAEYLSLTLKLAEAPLSCLPGECYSYQNVAFSLIGDVVAAASHQTYEQQVTQRIFKPLGMQDATLGLDGILSSRNWAPPHIRSRNNWVSLTPKPTYYRVPPAAGVNASISDMAQWLVAQTGHRPDVLPAPLLATLHAPIIYTPGELRAGWRNQRLGSASYALGWRIFDYAGHQVVFHAGAVQGYRAMVALIPERDMGMVVLWNSESALPVGLLPTMLDRVFALPAQQWLDTETTLGADSLLVERGIRPQNPAGTSSSRAMASPP